MIEHALTPHPSAARPRALELTAQADRIGTVLSLRYRLVGDLASVALPPRAAARRADRLWERTCFEAFVAPDGRRGYAEINLSPSTEWAAYAFDGYRLGMHALPVEHEPVVVVSLEPRALVVTASVDLAALDAARSAWRIGLAAVVATQGGAKGYWALQHTGAAPDFHAAAGFVVRL